MLNLLRMNLYRLLRTRGMFVLLIITMSFGIVSAAMEAMEMNSEPIKVTVGNRETGEESNAPDEGVFGVYVSTPVSEDGGIPSFLQFYCADMSSGIILIFLTIAAVLFVHGEEKSGFIKNIAGQVKRKHDIYLSKFLILAGYIFIAMLLYGVVQFCTLRLHYGPEFAFGSGQLGDALPCFGAQILMHLAFISGIMMLTEVTKSSAAGISVGIVALCGLGRIVTGLLYKILKLDIDRYLLVTNINSISFGADAAELGLGIGAAAVYCALYHGIGILWFTKKDIV